LGGSSSGERPEASGVEYLLVRETKLVQSQPAQPFTEESDMTDTRHPASDGDRYDIPDLSDQAAVEAHDQRSETYGHAQLDYSDADIPDLAGEVQENAE
jgi:hypothetical protein